MTMTHWGGINKVSQREKMLWTSETVKENNSALKVYIIKSNLGDNKMANNLWFFLIMHFFL